MNSLLQIQGLKFKSPKNEYSKQNIETNEVLQTFSTGEVGKCLSVTPNKSRCLGKYNEKCELVTERQKRDQSKSGNITVQSKVHQKVLGEDKIPPEMLDESTCQSQNAFSSEVCSIERPADINKSKSQPDIQSISTKIDVPENSFPGEYKSLLQLQSQTNASENIRKISPNNEHVIPKDSFEDLDGNGVKKLQKVTPNLIIRDEHSVCSSESSTSGSRDVSPVLPDEEMSLISKMNFFYAKNEEICTAKTNPEANSEANSQFSDGHSIDKNECVLQIKPLAYHLDVNGSSISPSNCEMALIKCSNQPHESLQERKNISIPLNFGKCSLPENEKYSSENICLSEVSDKHCNRFPTEQYSSFLEASQKGLEIIEKISQTGNKMEELENDTIICNGCEMLPFTRSPSNYSLESLSSISTASSSNKSTSSSIRESLEKRNLQNSIDERIEESLISDHLDLSNLDLPFFPSAVISDDVSKITRLSLHDNLIRNIPGSILKQFVSLKWLDLRFNRLKRLSEDIGHLANLEVLLLQKNKIKHLPLNIGLLGKLKIMQLSENSLRFPPQEIVQEGLARIMEFLKERLSHCNTSSTLLNSITIECTTSKSGGPKSVNETICSFAIPDKLSSRSEDESPVSSLANSPLDHKLSNAGAYTLSPLKTEYSGVSVSSDAVKEDDDMPLASNEDYTSDSVSSIVTILEECQCRNPKPIILSNLKQTANHSQTNNSLGGHENPIYFQKLYREHETNGPQLLGTGAHKKSVHLILQPPPIDQHLCRKCKKVISTQNQAVSPLSERCTIPLKQLILTENGVKTRHSRENGSKIQSNPKEDVIATPSLKISESIIMDVGARIPSLRETDARTHPDCENGARIHPDCENGSRTHPYCENGARIHHACEKRAKIRPDCEGSTNIRPDCDVAENSNLQTENYEDFALPFAEHHLKKFNSTALQKTKIKPKSSSRKSTYTNYFAPKLPTHKKIKEKAFSVKRNKRESIMAENELKQRQKMRFLIEVKNWRENLKKRQEEMKFLIESGLVKLPNIQHPFACDEEGCDIKVPAFAKLNGRQKRLSEIEVDIENCLHRLGQLSVQSQTPRISCLNGDEQRTTKTKARRVSESFVYQREFQSEEILRELQGLRKQIKKLKLNSYV